MSRVLTVVVLSVYFFCAPIYTQVDHRSVAFADTPLSSHFSPKTNFTRVPFENVKGLILVQAQMEGRTGNFILDTGAPNLIINGENVAGETQEMLSLSGETAAQTVHISHFIWGGIEKNGIEALALDISHLEETYQREILGVIGYQIFSDREILFDAPNSQIIIFNGEKNDLNRIGRPLTTLAFTMQDHLPVMEAQIGSSSYRFGFDSGCSVNLLDQKTAQDLPANAFEVLRLQDIQGFNQEVLSVPVIRTSSVQVADLPATNMDFLLVDLSHLRDSEVEIDGLLGYPFFKNLTFSINYTKGTLRIWKIYPDAAEMIP